MRRILLLMCIVSLNVSAQGYLSRGLNNGVKRMGRYWYPLTEITIRHIEQNNRYRYGNIITVSNFPMVKTDSITLQHTGSPIATPDSITLQYSLSKVENTEYTNELSSKLADDYESLSGNSLTNITSGKQNETEKEYSAFMTIIFCIVGLLAFCVISIVFASFLEERKSKTKPLPKENNAKLPNQQDCDYVYLANGLGIIMKS